MFFSSRKLKFTRKIDCYIPSQKTQNLFKARNVSEELIKEHYAVMRYMNLKLLTKYLIIFVFFLDITWTTIRV